MHTIGPTIADSAEMGPKYAARLLKDIPAERFARMAAPGGTTVDANHPAFILGHLCLYPVKVLELLGLDTTPAVPPPGFDDVFSKNAKCTDDETGTLYPAHEAIVAFFETSYAAALAALRSASDEQLLAENPVDTPMKQVCPTLGSLLAFYMNGHVMTHLGQLSTWRRMEAMPPA